jgi:hypothetical protein
MNRQLHIVGTGHHYQFGAGISFGGFSCSAKDHIVFAKMLRKLATSVAAETIAEEANEQALRDVGSRASVPQLVAHKLKIFHLFCDPDRTERQLLGIHEENMIRVSAFPEMLNEATVQQLSAQSWRRREEEWLRRLNNIKATRIIFICGAEHIATFPALAVQRGFQVVVEHATWEA